MPKLSNANHAIIRLIKRAPGDGEDWRVVGTALEKFITDFSPPDLIETKWVNSVLLVRLSEKGRTILEYL